MTALGIDIGGSGIKAAPVDIKTGTLVADRLRLATPSPATPRAIAKVVKKVIKSFEWQGAVGCGFPAVIRHGVAHTAANIHKSWIGTDVRVLFQEAIGQPVAVINDADAAGLAEMQFGAGRDRRGSVLLITIGTGLGTALFINGVLVPNCEFGHVILHKKIAEHYASDAVRQQENLSWKKWGKRFNEYLHRLEFLLSPDLFILGGGASKKIDKFRKFLSVDAEVVPAHLRNGAGIVGAALASAQNGRLDAQP